MPREKNVLETKVQAGVMSFNCDHCKSRRMNGTGWLSVPLFLYEKIRVWGAQKFAPVCKNCGASFRVTLTP